MAEQQLSVEIQAEAGKAVSQLDKIVNSLGRIEKVLSSVFDPLKRIEDALNKVNNAKVNIKINTKDIDTATAKLKKMKELEGASNRKGGSNAHQRGFDSDVVDNATKGYSDSLGKVYEDLGKNLPAVSSEITSLGTAIQSVNQQTEEFSRTAISAKSSANSLGDAFSEEYSEIQDRIQEALIKQKEYNAVIRQIEKDAKNSYEKDKYASAVIGASNATETVKKYKEQLIAVDKALKTIQSFTPSDTAQMEQIKELVSEYQELIRKRKEYQEINKQVKDTPTLFSEAQVAEAVSGLSAIEKRMAEIREQIIVAGESAKQLESLGAISADLPKIGSQGFEDTTAKVEEVRDAIQELVHQINEYKQIINSFEADKGEFSTEQYNEALTKLPELQQQLKNYKDSLKDVSGGLGDSEISEDADHIKSKIEELIEKIRQYKATIRDMEGGKVLFDKSAYDEALSGLPQAEQALAKYKAALQGVQGSASKPANKGINAFRALATAVNTATRSMNNIADAGIKAAKAVSSPIMGLGSALKNETSRIAKAFTSMHKAASKAFKGMSKLWETFLKKFRNYIIFKIISAIIKGLQEATNSLAQFSNATGTLFNSSISNIIADFAMIGRAILGAVEPIINKVVPIFDMLAEKIANVSNIVSQFFAALGGQGYAMQAKKRVENYAESLDKAKKSAKALTLGIDELNVISDKNDDEDEKNYMDEWEVTPIDPAILDFADKIRQKFQDLLDWLKQNFGALWDDLFGDFDLMQFAKDLFKPILEAWELTKDKLGESFAHLVNSLGWLFKDMADDFMEVWSQVDTRKIFENILNAIADIMEGIARLADNFREAWNFNDTGKKILEDIRDIIKIITDWIAKAAAYFKEWAKDVDFKPLLTSFERLLQSLKKIVDFVMHELYDIFTIVILGWAKFLIEEGLPLLNEQFKKIADGFPAEKVQKNLEKIWKAIERLGEEIFKGVALAIGDIGDMFNKFLDSERFEKFVDTIVTVMKKIDSEDVRKIIDGVAIAIGDLATALIDFVNSEQFMAFIDKLDRWLANASAQDIADILKKVAAAILLFKFAGFVGPGVSAFLTFLGALKRLDITGPIGALQKLAPGVTSISGVVSSAVKGFGSFISVLGEMTSGIPLLSGALTGLGSVLTFLAPLIGVVFVGAMAAAGIALIATGGDVAKATDIINQGIEKLKNIDFKAVFDSIASTLASWVNKLFEVLANIDWKGVWDTIVNLLLGLVSGIATFIADIDWSNVVSALVQCVIGLFVSVITHLPEIVVTIVELAFALGSALIEAFIGVFKGLYESFKSIGGDIIGGVFKGIIDAIVGLGKWLKEHIFDPIVDGIKKLFGIASPSKVMAEIGGFLIEGLIEGMTNLINSVFEVVGQIVEGIKKLFSDGVEAIKTIWNGITEFFSTLWTSVNEIFTSAWELLKGIISNAWEAIKTVWNGATQFFSDIWNGLVGIFTSVWNTLSGIVTGAWDTIKSVWSAVTQFFTDIWNSVSSVFTSAWNAIGQVVSNAWTFIQGIWNGAVSFFEGLIDGIRSAFDTGVNAIKEFWNGLWQAVQNAWNNAVSFFSGIVENIKQAFDNGVKAIQGFFEDAWNFIKGIWDKAKKWFEDIVKGIKDAFDNGIKAIKDFWQDLWKGIQDLWKDAVKWFGDIVKSIKEAFQDGVEAIQKVWDDLWSGIEKLWNGAVKWFTDIIKAIGDKFDEGIKTILKFWSDLWEDIKKVWEKAGDFFKGILDKIHKFFEDAMGKIQDLWQKLWDAIAKIWTDAKEWFKTAIHNIIEAITGTFKNAWSAMKSIGKNLIDGIVEGMKNAVGAFGSVVKAIKDWTVNKFKDIFKIHSPSQVFADEVGQYLTLGLFEGMEDEANGTGQLVKSAITDPFLNAIRDQFGIHSPSTAMAEIGSYLVEGLSEGLSGESKEALMATIGSLIEEVRLKFEESRQLIQEVWTIMPEWFNTTIFQPLIEMVTDTTNTILTLISEQCSSVQTQISDTWTYVQEIWQGMVEWFNESVIVPLIEMVTEACETIKALADGVLEKITEVIETISELIHSIIEVVTEVCDTINTLVNDLITELTDVITEAFETLKAQVEETSELIRTQATETSETVKQLALETWEYVKSIWEEAPTWFDGVLEELVSVFEKRLQEIADLWQANWDFIAQLWTDAIEFFDATLEEIKGIFETKLEEIKPFWQDLWDFIEQLWTDAIPVFEDLMEQIRQIQEDMLQAASELWQENWNTISEIWEAAPDWFNDIISQIKDGFEEGINEISELWTQLWEDIKETWEEAVEFFTDIVQQIVDTFNEGNEAIMSSFEELFNGISEKASAMLNSISEQAQSIAESIRSLMGVINGELDQVIRKAEEAKKIAADAGANVSGKSTTTTKSTSKTTTTTTGDSKIDALFEKANSQLAGIKDSLSKASDSNKKAQESLEKAQDQQKQSQDKEVSILSKATSVISRGLGLNVPSFSTGGFPENGMFFANSTEMVGRFTNGRTAVANNDQIVNGIAYGVEQAINNSLAGHLQAIENGQKQQINQKTSITLDGRELVGALDNRRSRNGFSFT